jgi:hypothetical protein
VRRIAESNSAVYQLEGVAYPGNRSGHVFDADTSEVVGAINAVAIRGTYELALSNPTSLSYAITVPCLRELLERC